MRAGADFVRYVRTYSGPHSAVGVRWPQATDRRMADGELLVTDVVGAYWGQQFDVNRTFVVGRRPSDRQRRQLDAALEATRAAIAAARPGVPAEALVAAANRVIEDRGFGAHARPFIGHGIGYETMEPPLLFTGDTTPLEPGMVLCVEPGIEIPGEEGVRIEEEIIVTDGEPELITRFAPRQWE
jgi:Xaa-Pro dipeptidase